MVSFWFPSPCLAIGQRNDVVESCGTGRAWAIRSNVHARVLLVSSVIRCKLNRRCDPRSPRRQHWWQGITVCPQSGQCAEIDRYVFEYVLYHASQDARFADAGLHPLGVLTSHMRPSSPFSDLYNKREPMAALRSRGCITIYFCSLDSKRVVTAPATLSSEMTQNGQLIDTNLAVVTTGTSRLNPSSGQRLGKQVLQHILPIATHSTAHPLWSTHKPSQGSRAPGLPGSQAPRPVSDASLSNLSAGPVVRHGK